MRIRVVAGLLVAAMALASCGVPGEDPQGAAASAPTTEPSVTGMRPGVFPSTRVEPPSGVRPPDDPNYVPDGELTDADVAALIQQPASADPAAGSCGPDDLALSLHGSDVALGHRFSQLLVTNIGGRECALIGWPGLGFRGVLGTTFPIVADRDPSASDRVGAVPHDPAVPVSLAPGASATADLEWTGALAGATEENVSLMAVQFVADGPVARLAIPAADHVDIGESTTVRVRQWAPAAE